MTRLRVADDAAGARLDRYLATVAAIGSRTLAERLLADGAVLVDGRRRAKSHRLAGGEELELALPEPEPAGLVPEEVDLVIAYEDEHLLVVDKPAGVVVHPAPGHGSGTLVHGLLAAGAEGGDEERPGIVHRLDRDTSGLLVVARSDEAHRRLEELVRNRALTREYLALVVGRPRSRRGTIDAPIGRDRHDRLRRSLDTDSPREAVTHFEVEELLPRHALLRVRLETGRTHQIRVHLAAIDLPVAGDAVYGRAPGATSARSSGRASAASPATLPATELGLERQFLHAARLAFEHPFGGRPVDVSSQLPDDLAAALERARS